MHYFISTCGYIILYLLGDGVDCTALAILDHVTYPYAYGTRKVVKV